MRHPGALVVKVDLGRKVPFVEHQRRGTAGAHGEFGHAQVLGGHPRAGVADDQRCELAAGEDVRSDRQHVRCEVLVNALVEALVAAAQKRYLGLGGELIGQGLIELAAPWRQGSFRSM